jgi:hypothetical protein
VDEGQFHIMWHEGYFMKLGDMKLVFKKISWHEIKCRWISQAFRNISISSISKGTDLKGTDGKFKSIT